MSVGHQTPPRQTVILTGGGTGGHIFPALAIGEALQRINPELKLLYVGGTGKMESRLVPERGIVFVGIPIDGLQRSLSIKSILRNLSLPFKVARSMASCFSLLGRVGVSGVVATGGYVCLPVLLAARIRGVPYVMNEQNAFPGLVTRMMSNGARKVYLGMSDAKKHLSLNESKVLVSGNPVRSDLGQLTKVEACTRLGSNSIFASGAPLAPDRPILAVLGGSLGARTLNLAVESNLLPIEQSCVQVIWQTGAKYVLPESAKSTLPSSVHLVPFIDDMPAVYAAADLVVCRAGALTLSELAAAGRPAIVVPSPNVTDDHQTHNARALERAGTALVVADSVAADQLIPLALTLMSGDHRLQVMTGLAGALQATLRLSPPAAEQIAAGASEQFKLASHG